MNERYMYYVSLPTIVCNYPCLYDRGNPQFGNRQLKDELWSHIAKQINHGGGIELLESRWKNVRDRYQRCKKNMETGKSQSMSPLFDCFTFLDPFIVGRGPSAVKPVTPMSCTKEAFNARLIKKVRENRCLYEVSKGCHNVTDRKMAWETIKVEMNFKEDVAQLATLWKRLRDKYVKTKVRIQKYPSVRQTWVHFNQMTWLDMYLDKNSRSNGPPAAQRIYYEDIAGVPDGYEAVYDMPEDHGDEQEEVQHVDADVADQMMVDNAEPVEWIQVPDDCEVIPVVQNVQPEVQYEPQNGPVLTEGRNGVKYIEINGKRYALVPMAGERQDEEAGRNEENVNVLQEQGEQFYSPPGPTNYVQDGYRTAGGSEENINVLQEQGEQFYSPPVPTNFEQVEYRTAGESEENVNVLQEQGEQFYSPSGPTDFTQDDYDSLHLEVY
ncbi:unnamed protein product [Caenorhabditis sp. 36 PRJEB53466]|nr:unnamed protein product [Caenorhabditis sp. 36 PRJEB53466]